MSKNLPSLLSTISVVLSILLATISIDNAIKQAAISEEARLTKIEETFYVYRDKLDSFIAKTQKGEQDLTRYLFDLEKRLNKCK